MEGRHAHRGAEESDEISVNPLFARPGEETVPRWRIPDGEMLPETRTRSSTTSSSSTATRGRTSRRSSRRGWSREATQLYIESFDKNMIDKDEYPQTAAIEERCIHILADLWNAPDPHATIGTSAIGSSEACMLAGLAFKRRWQQRRDAPTGKSTESPNIVFSSAVQVVWEKFANYFEVEPRYVPITKDEPYLTPEGMLAAVDENTIGVVPDPRRHLQRRVRTREGARGRARRPRRRAPGSTSRCTSTRASGGFIAPFLDPDLEWDFRVPRVHSISTSGHKFGLVYPGLGWVVWAKREYLPEELIFNVSYLGGNMPTLALNFSRPGAQVLLAVLQLPPPGP